VLLEVQIFAPGRLPRLIQGGQVAAHEVLVDLREQQRYHYHYPMADLREVSHE
jgi:hypothetical protein